MHLKYYQVLKKNNKKRSFHISDYTWFLYPYDSATITTSNVVRLFFWFVFLGQDMNGKSRLILLANSSKADPP